MSARTRASWALPAACAALVVLAGASLAVGDVPLGPRALWAGLTGADPYAAGIIWELRLPRLLVAALVGGALSASGVAMQAYFRNGLASPGLLGVSSGGAAGAVGAIACGWASASLMAVPAAAIVGALAATGAVVGLARRGAGTERLLLAGVGVNALLGALSSFLLSRSTLSFERNGQILFWLLGGLEDRTWLHVLAALPILPAALLLLPLGRPMDLLSLGTDEARSLGVDVPRLGRRLLVLSTVLTALATAVAGTVGFVGRVVPHILRLLAGPAHRRLLPLSVVGGAAFVVACDIAGRAAGGGLRIGIVTSIIGGPYFLWLLRSRP